MDIPPLPEGFVLQDEGGDPPPPAGFTLQAAEPAPPSGFQVVAQTDQGAAPASGVGYGTAAYLALKGGAREVASNAMQTGALAATGNPGKPLPIPAEEQALSAPISYGHLPTSEGVKKGIYQLGKGLVSSAPEMVGAAIGAGVGAGAGIETGPGALLTGAAGAGIGAGLVTAAKSFAPLYGQELQRLGPGNEDAAFNSALKLTGIESAGSALSFGLFEGLPLKGFLRDIFLGGKPLEEAAIKNGARFDPQSQRWIGPGQSGSQFVTQQIPAQGVVAAGEHMAVNAEQGNDPTEGLGNAVIGTGIGLAAPWLAHQAGARVLRPVATAAPELRQNIAEADAALRAVKGEQKPSAPPESAPELEPAQAAPEQPAEAPADHIFSPPPAAPAWDRMKQIESGNRQFDQHGMPIISPAGAVGISQIMPETARAMAAEMGVPFDLARLYTDPAYNEALGKAYQEKMLARYGGDEAAAAAAYNAGPGNVDRWIKNGQRMSTSWVQQIDFPETANYLRKMGSAEPGGPRDVAAAAPSDPNNPPIVMLPPSMLRLDPERFQYKESNERGETGRLSSAKAWEPLLADKVTAYEDLDGNTYVVNGHQRTNLAQRAEAAGQEGIQVPAQVFRAADGWTPEAMKVLGALQNIAQESGTALDAARVMRNFDPVAMAQFHLPDLPPGLAMVKAARGLANLSPDVFKAVENGVVAPEYATFIGQMLEHPAEQMAALDVLNKVQPNNANQARMVVADIKNSGFMQGSQTTLFGDEQLTNSLFVQRAQVLDAATKILNAAKRTFGAAVKGEDVLTGAGNKLDAEANVKGRAENDQLIKRLTSEAAFRGDTSDALNAAAADLAGGKQLRGVVADFLAKARSIDARGDDTGHANGHDDHGARPAGEAGGEAPVEGQGGFFARRAAAERADKDAAAPPAAKEARAELQGALERIMRFMGLPKGVRLDVLVDRVIDSAERQRIRAISVLRELEVPRERWDGIIEAIRTGDVNALHSEFPAGARDSAVGRIARALKPADAEGNYGHGLIEIALDAKAMEDPKRVPVALWHEAMHALMDPELNLVSKSERAALMAGADRWLNRIDPKTGESGRALLEARGYDAAQMRAEAIAQLAERALNHGLLPQGIGTQIIGRLRNMITGLGQALRGEGYKTADDVFRGMLEGKRAVSGEPGVGSSGAPAGGKFMQIGDIEAELPDRYLSRRQKDEGTPLLSDKAGLERTGQTVIPGAERSDQQALQLRGEAPMRGKAGQKDTGDLPLFDTGARKQGSLFSRRPWGDEVRVPLYSATERAVGRLPQAKGTGEQMLAQITKAPGVKPEELKWLDLPNWLRGQKSVTRDQIAEYVRANALNVREVLKSADRENATRALEPELRALGLRQQLSDISMRMIKDAGGSIDLQHRWEDAQKQLREDSAKYASYQLPGGENYRELLITMPPKERSGGARDTNVYRSSHWDEPNVLAHIRFSERTAPDGKRVLLIEEGQSDWHQRGRKKGYQEPPAPVEKITTLPPDYKIKQFSNGSYNVRDNSGFFITSRSFQTREEAIAYAIEDANRRAIYRAERPYVGDKVPDAPFKTSWPALVMKRMTKYAIDNGFDRVAWTPGDEQAARYDLSKQISALDYQKNPDGTYKLSFQKDGRGNAIGDAIAADKLEDYFGKDVAQRIIDGSGKPQNFAGNNERPNVFHRLEGLDLKVGGEGMRGFYDDILPKETQKIVGKFGARVKESEVHTGDFNDGVIDADGPAYDTQRVHSFDITPEMRKTVGEDGLPLFSRRDPREVAREETLFRGATPEALAEHARQLSLAMASKKPPGQLGKIADSILRTLSPTSRPGAKAMEFIIRRSGAGLDADTQRFFRAMLDVRDAFNRMSTEEMDAFTDRRENRQKQPTPALQKVDDTLEVLNTKIGRMIQSRGKGLLPTLREGYSPHIYGNYAEWRAGLEHDEASMAAAQDRVQASGMSKGPIRGSGAFLKPRTFETLKEAMAAGLEPVTHNPIDVAMIKAREMLKYYHGDLMADTIKQAGLAHWVPYSDEGSARAAGWAKLDDSVFQPRIKDEAYGVREVGNWYAPEPVATVFNNYVAKGFGGNPIFDLIRQSGNALNQMQLGFSAFHPTFVSIDTMVSKMALGLEEVMRGQFGRGFKDVMLGAPVMAPYTVVANARRGARLQRALLDPENAPPEMRPILNAALTGGARIGQQQFYRSDAAGPFFRSLKDVANPSGAFRDAVNMVKDTPLKAPFRIAARMLETINEPLMGHFVPKAKLGIFSDMASSYLAAHPDATAEAKQAAFTKMWDSVDNRMGQLVYDNLFWHKTLKDLAFISTRSVGWNLGTVRELGGAAVDTAQAAANMARFRSPDFTARMAYALALPMFVGTLGAMLTYLRTGQGPQSTLDYFFPPDENGENRISIPSYIKDVIEYTHAPVQTVLNKMHPLASIATQLYQNKDFYGGSIYNSDFQNPAVAYAEYILNQALPFSVRGAMRQNVAGKDSTDQALSFFGFVPAPQSIANPEREVAWQHKDDMKAWRRQVKETASGNRIGLPSWLGGTP